LFDSSYDLSRRKQKGELNICLHYCRGVFYLEMLMPLEVAAGNYVPDKKCQVED